MTNYQDFMNEKRHFTDLYRAFYKGYRYNISDDLMTDYLSRLYTLVFNDTQEDNSEQLELYTQFKKDITEKYLTFEYAFDNLVMRYNDLYNKVHGGYTTTNDMKKYCRDIFKGNKYLQVLNMLIYLP